MTKTKTWRVLKTFSKSELKEFSRFLKSPFHNPNKNLLKLYLIILKYISAGIELPGNEIIYTKLFPGKKYDGLRFRVLLSGLMKQIEEFLAVRSFISDRTGKQLKLLTELNRRRLGFMFESKFRETESELNNKEKVNHNYFLKRYELYYEKIDYLISVDEQTQTSGLVLENGENLISFFIAGILNIAHELKIHEEVLNTRFNANIVEYVIAVTDFKKIIDKMKLQNYRFQPVLDIYYQMYIAYTHADDDSLYTALKEKITQNLCMFDDKEKFNLYIILESICVTKLSTGKRYFYEKLFELYKEMVSQNIFLASKDNYFQLNLFRNMFYTAVYLNDFQWAEKFLEQHSMQLHPHHRDDMYYFSRALVSFEKKEYGKALTFINKVNQDFFVFKYDSKIAMLKIFYELEMFEQALSLIDSFSHYLSGNRNVPPLDRERFGNFLKHVRQMVKIKTGQAKLNEFEMVKSLEKENIISKRWIAKKAVELTEKNHGRGFIWR